MSTFRIEVSFQSEEGEESSLGHWQGQAKSLAEARGIAIDELFDDRLSAASCSPITRSVPPVEPSQSRGRVGSKRRAP